MKLIDSTTKRNFTKTAVIGQIAAWLIVLAIVLSVEIARYRQLLSEGARSESWLFGLNIDTSPFLILLAFAPLFWIYRGHSGAARTRWKSSLVQWLADGPHSSSTNAGPNWTVFVAALLIGSVSWSASSRIANYELDSIPSYRFGDLPPAYHDEFSYKLQARTFVDGRLSYPSHPTHARLFDQMHVLNEGNFASRYWPGTGLWMSPFLALGHLYWGYWLAGALCSVLVFLSGRELSCNGVGLLAGMVTALSPGLGLFSNLLLAHHPTVISLSMFLYSFLRMLRNRSRFAALTAGIALAFAMACRPMTAAGFGLPFGLFLLIWAFRSKDETEIGKPSPIVLTCWVGGPVLLGLALLLAYNQAITGSAWEMPYQLYTEIYTPRHVYGFNNVVRGELNLTERTIDNYDRWAINLTPTLAARNVLQRLMASWQWTLGVVPLLLATIVFLFLYKLSDRRWWFVPLAIVSLHAVHVPYWFVGIMNWHYVFETAPLWALLFAFTSGRLIGIWRQQNRSAMPLWWAAVTVTAVAVNLVSFAPFWSPSRLVAGVQEVAFSRLQHQRFRETIDRLVTSQSALVLVEADPAERGIDYIVNWPGISEPVLLARYRPETHSIEDVMSEFNDRAVYFFRMTDWQLFRIVRSTDHSGPQPTYQFVPMR